MINFADLQRTIAEIGAQIATKKSQREQLAEERDRIAALPFARADLIQAYDTWVQEAGALYNKHLLEIAKTFSRHPDRPFPKPVIADDRLGILTARDKNAVLSHAVLALCAPMIRERLAELLRELPLDDADALPLVERAQKLKDLDERIEGLDAEIARIEEQATAAGLRPAPRRLPTRDELEQQFSGGRLTNPEVYARAVENLTRQINGELPMPPVPLPEPIVKILPEELPE